MYHIVSVWPVDTRKISLVTKLSHYFRTYCFYRVTVFVLDETLLFIYNTLRILFRERLSNFLLISAIILTGYSYFILFHIQDCYVTVVVL